MDINNKQKNLNKDLKTLLAYDFLEREEPDIKTKKSFNKLPFDAYLKHKYSFRKRAFSKCILKDKFELSIAKSNTFEQDIRINKYAGGIKRIYEHVDNNVIIYVRNFMLKNENYFSNLKQESKIGIHQIRITALNDNEGHPVPEGYHQDGVDYVIIIPIQSFSICGGINSIRYGSQDGPEIMDKKIKEKDALILNDKRVFHYASPIYAQYKNIEGFRDSIIITIEEV